MKREFKKTGRVTARLAERYPQQMVLDNPELEPQRYWDDWADPRDGMRGYDDHTKLRSPHMWSAEYLKVREWNKKIKAKLIVRKKRKLGGIRKI
jgi:hypothetical protein